MVKLTEAVVHAGNGGDITQRRKQEILTAAFELLLEGGYDEANTLAIARKAKTSKETLYNLFESKQLLFYSLIQWRIAETQREIEECAACDAPDLAVRLRRFGSALLRVWGREDNIAIIRTAAGMFHRTPEISELVIGRQGTYIRAFFAALLEAGKADGQISFDDPTDAYEAFVGLLFGGQVLRRLVGSTAAPEGRAIDDQVGRAVDRFLILFAPPKSAG